MTDRKLSHQEKCERLMRYASRVGAAFVTLEPEEEVDRELARYEAWLGDDMPVDSNSGTENHCD